MTGSKYTTRDHSTQDIAGKIKREQLSLEVVHKAALALLNEGISPVPVEYQSKAPIHDWDKVPTTKDSYKQRFKGKFTNIGVRLGELSNGLTDVDLDCSEAIALAPAFLPFTGRIFGRASKPRSHSLYGSDLVETEDLATLQYKDGKGGMLVEIRIGGGGNAAQTVVPPSFHPSGEQIQWHTEGEFTQVDGEELKRAVAKLAAASLIYRHYPEAGMQARHNYWLTIDGYMSRAGWSEEERRHLIEAVSTAAGDPEVKDRVAVCAKTEGKLSGNKRIPGLPSLRKLLGEKDADKIDEWLRPRQISDGLFPDLNKHGQPIATLANAMVGIRSLGVRCRYDQLSLETMLDGEALGGTCSRATDAALRKLRWLIREKFGFDPGKEAVCDAMMTLADESSFHPVRDYLDSLKWDETPRIDNWLTTYAGAKDTPYTRAVGSIFLIAMARRARQPGAKFDEILVLEGEQGTGRSTALAILAGAEHFSDSVRLTMKDKELIEQIRGKWLIEIAELGDMRKAEVEHIKAFASRGSDRARLAYDRLTTEAPRQCVFVGTTNDKHYLRDQTGNRRFWPVQMSRVELDALKLDRDQLFAEAAVREAKGESIRLPQELWEAAAEEQEQRTAADPWISVLGDELGELGGKIQSSSLFVILDVKAERQTQAQYQRIGAVMRELRWERRLTRFKGKVKNCYVRGDSPEEWEAIRIEGELIMTDLVAMRDLPNRRVAQLDEQDKQAGRRKY